MMQADTDLQYALCLRIIKQLTADGQKIKWTEIDMPGRTPKSLTHAWDKIRKEAESIGPADAPKAAPAKRMKKSRSTASLKFDYILT
jgi:hypothetical protein